MPDTRLRALSLTTMKDKKSIAIVMLAAITAGVGIFSIVSNKSKIDENTKLKSDRDFIQEELVVARKNIGLLETLRDELDLANKSQVNRIEALGAEVASGKVKVKDLSLNLEKSASETETLKLQHAQDLGVLEAKLQEVSVARGKLEVDLKVQADLVASKAKELERFAVESKERAKIITTLEAKNDNLHREKGSLEVKIATLNTEIDETNKKLDASEGDRSFLEGELLRLQEEKASLVKQMNDIEFLTAQVKRIKNDIAVARRMDWMRKGIGIYAKRKTVGQLHAAATGGGKEESDGEKGNENVAVELTTDGRLIINGKVIETETTAVPEKPEATVTGQPKK